MIVSDSMAMPRKEVPYEDTWIYLLKKELSDYDIIDRPVRGSTTLRLVTEGGGGLDLLEHYTPDLVIIQMGMAECAPRLFKKTGMEYFLMNKVMNHRMRQKYIAFIKRTRARDPLLTEIPPQNFKLHVSLYSRRAALTNTRILAVQIIKANSHFISKSPHIQQNVDTYNALLREIEQEQANFHVIDPFNDVIDMDEITIDELHLTALGHKILFQKLKDSIYTLINTKIIIGR